MEINHLTYNLPETESFSHGESNLKLKSFRKLENSSKECSGYTKKKMRRMNILKSNFELGISAEYEMNHFLNKNFLIESKALRFKEMFLHQSPMTSRARICLLTYFNIVPKLLC